MGSTRRSKRSSDTSNTSRISTKAMESLIEKLKTQQTRKSTAKTYLCIWRKFNQFIIRLDVKPKTWEDRASLFLANMVQEGKQSASIRSYLSAIKRTLIDDGYCWDDNKILLNTLTKACRIINDRVYTRLPIQCGLFELILFELQRVLLAKNQVYLNYLYASIFMLGYYGLMRVGELTSDSEHTLLAKNVHLATNKEKLLLILYSSKMHGKGSWPQKINITANKHDDRKYIRNFCPFKTVNEYINLRGPYESEQEEFFVFRDKTPVPAFKARSMLKCLIKNLGLDDNLYNFHSLRGGHVNDMVKKLNYSMEEAKRAGRWRSTAIYRYLK